MTSSDGFILWLTMMTPMITFSADFLSCLPLLTSSARFWPQLLSSSDDFPWWLSLMITSTDFLCSFPLLTATAHFWPKLLSSTDDFLWWRPLLISSADFICFLPLLTSTSFFICCLHRVTSSAATHTLWGGGRSGCHNTVFSLNIGIKKILGGVRDFVQKF